MKINKVQVTGDGIKGRCFEHDLTGVDVFYGQNGAGKSSRLLAITGARVGFADVSTDGQRPYIGEKPSASINIVFNDGAMLFRGAAESTRTATFKVTTERFEARLGPVLAQVDLSDVMRETDQARIGLLTRALAAHQASVDPTHAFVILHGDGEAKLALNGLLKENPKPVAKNMARWMQEAEVFADEKTKHWNAQAKEFAAVVRQGVEVIQGVRTVEAIEKDLEVYRRQLAEGAANAGARAEILKGREAHERLGSELSQALAGLDEEEAKAKAVVQAARGKWATLSRNVSVATAELDTLKQNRDTAAAGIPDLSEKVAEARKATAQGSDAVSGLKASVALLVELSNDAGIGASACRECGAEDPLNLAQRRERAEKLDLRHGAALVKRQEQEAALDKALDKAKVAVRHYDSLFSQAKVKLDTAQAELQRSTDAEATAKAGVEKTEEKRGALESRLRGWQDSEPPSISDAGVGGDEALLASMEQKVKELQTELGRAKQSEAAEATFLIAQEKRDKASSAWKSAKALKAALQKVRAWMDEQSYAPLTTAANEFLSAGNYRGAFYLAGPNDFGLAFGETRVVFWALSDSEKAMCGMAMTFAMAVCVQSPSKLLIVDNLERLDEAGLGSCIAAATALHAAGRLDNFVGAIVSQDGGVPAFAGSGEEPEVQWIEVVAP